MAAGDAPAQRTALADEVLLPDELVEVRGRIRAASGWRSGGGWKRASGLAPLMPRALGMDLSLGLGASGTCHQGVCGVRRGLHSAV